MKELKLMVYNVEIPGEVLRVMVDYIRTCDDEARVAHRIEARFKRFLAMRPDEREMHEINAMRLVDRLLQWLKRNNYIAYSWSKHYWVIDPYTTPETFIVGGQEFNWYTGRWAKTAKEEPVEGNELDPLEDGYLAMHDDEPSVTVTEGTWIRYWSEKFDELRIDVVQYAYEQDGTNYAVVVDEQVPADSILDARN